MNILHLAISPKQLSQNNCVISMESEKMLLKKLKTYKAPLKNVMSV